MNPVVGLRLAQAKVQPVHDLQRMGLLVDQNEQEFVGGGREHPFDPGPRAALVRLVGRRARGRIGGVIGGLESGQQLVKFGHGEASRGQKLTGPGS